MQINFQILDMITDVILIKRTSLLRHSSNTAHIYLKIE